MSYVETQSEIGPNPVLVCTIEASNPDKSSLVFDE
jgi:hypothetical protein